MAKYFEARKESVYGSLSTDMMRHLHTRQHLGKALVICEHPAVSLSAARKQWLKLSRNVQKKRAGTLDADKILKYTHAVTHMQHMSFTSKLPEDEPDADVYFLKPSALQSIPHHCLSVYLAARLTDDQLASLIIQMPSGALVTDYERAADWAELGFEPKQTLIDEVDNHWQQVVQFLNTYHIDIRRLSGDQTASVEFMEESLDILLGAHQKFLQVAGDFQRSLELARPLLLSKELRKHYDAVILLAHRVQALTPGAFTQSFLETYDENDAFFLYDSARERPENLHEAIDRHLQAGRLNLATALTNLRR